MGCLHRLRLSRGLDTVSFCSFPLPHHRCLAQGQPQGQGTFLFSCSCLTQELVLSLKPSGCRRCLITWDDPALELEEHQTPSFVTQEASSHVALL